MDAQIQPLSHLPSRLRQELQSAKEAKQAAHLKARRLQTAMMKTLLLLRGLGVMLEEPKLFLMAVYEDAERKQRVILARWNLKQPKKERCKLLFEFVFDKDELIIRWFDKTVAANLPNTQERKAIDAKRWQALYHCFMDLDKRDNLPDFVGFSIFDSEDANSSMQYSIGIRITRCAVRIYEVDSEFNILKQGTRLIFGR